MGGIGDGVRLGESGAISELRPGAAAGEAVAAGIADMIYKSPEGGRGSGRLNGVGCGGGGGGIPATSTAATPVVSTPRAFPLPFCSALPEKFMEWMIGGV